MILIMGAVPIPVVLELSQLIDVLPVLQLGLAVRSIRS